MSHTHQVKGPVPHVHSVWLYWGVFFALVFLTILTVYLAKFDFGKFNVLVTFLIAGTKSLLVLSIFMHLAFDNKFFALILGASLIFLGLFLLFPILDMASRREVDPQISTFLPRDEKVLKHSQDKPKALPLRPGLLEAVPEKLNFTPAGEH